MKKFIRSVLEAAEYNPVRLLQILQAVQAEYAHIPAPAITQIAETLAIPATQVTAVAEFYSFFSLTPQGRYHVLLSNSITDRMLGQDDIAAYLTQKLNVNIGQCRADGLVSLDNTSCTGLCDQGPAGLVNGYPLARLDRARIDTLAELIERQTPLADWPSELFAVQDNIRRTDLLLNNPLTPGTALTRLFSDGRDAIWQELDRSGLRGRGGAGYATAWKWHLCYEGAEQEPFCEVGVQQAPERYVVCNADEGEPGTFKDRVLLNSYADQMIEGMTVCAILIGARQGFIYLRGEYRFLLDKLAACLQTRRNAGLLGDDILGQGVCFDIEIRLGAGAYICGEESALIESLEGKPGVPRNRPPYPVSRGYLNKPTVVNNVETFWAAAAIVQHGGRWFAAVGTEKSAGSKLLSISGDCDLPGIYEYPYGVTIAQILADCGARDVQGVQIGGPSGTFIAAHEFQRTLAFEDLPTGGSFIIFNNNRRIFDIVQNFVHFFAHESCGFCTPCRVGTSLLQRQVDKIIDGHGSAGDVVELEALCRLVKNNSHCGLGQTAANPVLSTLERYPDLYQRQLKKISYEPGFDLDGALDVARKMARRDDAAAHLSQVED